MSCTENRDDQRLFDKGQQLYREVVSSIPFCVVSHRKLSEFDLSERPCANLTEWWIRGDETRQKLMLAAGVPQEYVQGKTSDYDAFRAFCSIMPQLVGNPVYEESHWELRRLFDCDLAICEDNCERIWQATAERFLMGDFTPLSAWKVLGVKRLCAICSPWDKLPSGGAGSEVRPIFCPDGDVGVRPGSTEWLGHVSCAADQPCTDWKSLCAALCRILDDFHDHGCRTAYHSLNLDAFERPHVYGADRAVRTMATGGRVDSETARIFDVQLLRFFMKEYAQRGWTVELCITGAREAEALFAYARRDRGWVWPALILSSSTLREDARIGELCSRLQTEITSVTDGGVDLSEIWDESTMSDVFRSYAARTVPGGYPGVRSVLGSLGGVWQQEQFRLALCHMAARWMDSGKLPNHDADIAAFLERICFQNAMAWTDGSATAE